MTVTCLCQMSTLASSHRELSTSCQHFEQSITQLLMLTLMSAYFVSSVCWCCCLFSDDDDDDGDDDDDTRIKITVTFPITFICFKTVVSLSSQNVQTFSNLISVGGCRKYCQS